MQEIESAAAEALGVAFGKRSSAHQAFVAIRGGIDQPAALCPSLDPCQRGIPLANNGGPLRIRFPNRGSSASNAYIPSCARESECVNAMHTCQGRMPAISAAESA